ncbi:MAG: hypothetical protein WCC32_08120 [Terriglobales bacterium]
MAAVAIIVVKLAPRGLLRVQAELGIRLPSLHIAAGKGENNCNQPGNNDTKKRAMADFRLQIAELKAQDELKVQDDDRIITNHS